MTLLAVLPKPRVPLALAMTLAFGVGLGGYLPSYANRSLPIMATPAADACQLPQTAFCDTFQPAGGGGRSGGLDPARWTVSRLSSAVVPFQFLVNNYPAATAKVCGTQKPVQPPGDVFVCGSEYGQVDHLASTINDGGVYNGAVRLPDDGTHPEYLEGNVVVTSSRVLQPFDFAGRTGTIVFDVDAQLDGSGSDRSHGWWPEVWLSDQPVEAPHLTAAHVNSVPRNGVGFVLNDCAGATVNQNAAGLSELLVVDNYVPTTLRPSQTCVNTKEGLANHFEIRISQSNIELFGSDVGGKNFRMLATADVNLPFSRGYLSLAHVHYNSAKYGYGNTNTLTWHAVGFDGPLLPADRAYEIPDAEHVITVAEAQQTGDPPDSVNLGYQLGSCNLITGCPCPPASAGTGTCPTPTAYSTPTFSVANVDLSGVQQAYLTYDVWYDLGSHQIDATINGTTSRIDDPNRYCGGSGVGDCYTGVWRSLVQPIPLSALHAGINTVSLSAPSPSGQNPTVANIDLDLVRKP